MLVPVVLVDVVVFELAELVLIKSVIPISDSDVSGEIKVYWRRDCGSPSIELTDSLRIE